MTESEEPGATDAGSQPSGGWQREVRGALMAWDAIGVADVPQAADEYDCMIGPLVQQLSDGNSEQELARWIATERAEHFGLCPDADADRELAQRLVAWWPQRVTP